MDKVVDQLFCNAGSARYGTYQRLGEGIGLLGGKLRQYPMLDINAQQVVGLAQLAPKLLGQQHEDLLELLDRVEEWREYERASEVSVEPLTDPDQHQRALLDLIREAERQLVLACPWIRYETLQPLLGPLRQRLREGVQVFLLWGIARDETLRSAVRTALQNLTRDFPTRAFISLRSSHSHAKLALQDDRQALVTSLNFLRPSAPSTVELGVLLRPAGERPCPPIERLLRWARETYPEYRIARAMYVTHGDFNRTRRAGSAPETTRTSNGPRRRRSHQAASKATRPSRCGSDTGRSGWRSSGSPGTRHHARVCSGRDSMRMPSGRRSTRPPPAW